MMFSRFRLILAFLIISLTTSSGYSQQKDDEYYFRLLIQQRSETDVLTRLISVDDVRGDTVLAYATGEQLKAVRALGYSIEMLPHPGSRLQHEMYDGRSSFMYEWDRYPTYQAYLSMMREFAQNYPQICRLDTIGLSVQGRLLLAVKISKNVELKEEEPVFLYSSTMHGDETVGYVLLLRLADHLLSNYGVATPDGERATRLIDSMEIWINPLANPDGTYRLGGDTTVSNARRFNANNIDLNRNFPDRVVDTNNTTAGRQVETQAFMRWTAKHRFNLSANFHGGAQVVNYPWDNGAASGSYSASPDDAWFINLSRAYATPNPDLMSGGFSNGITNGCQWYAINGGRQDWIYWWYGGRETTIELWNTKNPSGSVLPGRWTSNKESLLAYMEYALKGIRGEVRDAGTGLPLKARIDVRTIANAPVYSDSVTGGFYRFVLPGQYDLIVRCSGYLTDTLRAIIVGGGPAVSIDVNLQPSIVSVPPISGGIAGSFRLEQNYPNPFNPRTIISFQSSVSGFVALKVYDVLGREVATLVNEAIEPGRHSVTWDANSMPSGVYFYRLTTPWYTSVRKMLFLK